MMNYSSLNGTRKFVKLRQEFNLSPFLFHKSILFLNQEKIQRQRSLPEGYYSHTEEKPKSIKESLLAVTGGKKFDKFRESISKFRSTEKSTNCTNQEQASLKVTFNYFFRWHLIYMINLSQILDETSLITIMSSSNTN